MEDVAGMAGDPGVTALVNVEQQAPNYVSDMQMSLRHVQGGVALPRRLILENVVLHAITVLRIHVVNVAVTLLVITGIAVKKVTFYSEIIMVLCLGNLNKSSMQ